MRINITIAALTCLLLGARADEQKNSEPTVRPAADAIFKVFEKYPLVGIGDKHGLAQELDFYMTLIRDPRFARDVGNVVVEFGGAAHQDTIDHYVAGDHVPYLELRKVWTDVVGWSPTVTGLGYLNFYADVRAVNLKLPPGQRIHVLLGEPKIDWTRIEKITDWMQIAGFRNEYPAELIEQNILSKHKKALVIYGTAHFGPPIESMEQMERERKTMEKRLGTAQPLQLGLQSLVEKKYPNSFFVISPYDGFVEPACSKIFEQYKMAWPIPALAMPIKGTSLTDELQAHDCHFLLSGANRPPPDETQAEARQIEANTEAMLAGLTADALLFLGPAEKLTRTTINPDLYLDLDYQAEVSGHSKILSGQPFDVQSERRSVSPQPWR